MSREHRLMSASVPAAVDEVAAARGFGSFQGKTGQKTNIAIIVYDVAVLPILVVLVLTGRHAVTVGNAGLAVTGLVALLLTAFVGWQIVATVRNRKVYLYQRGMVVVGVRGQIRHAEPWRDLEVFSKRTYYQSAGVVAKDRDEYGVFKDGRILLRHNQPRDLGFGQAMVALAAAEKIPRLQEQFDQDHFLTFGPFTVTREALVHRDRSIGWNDIEQLVIDDGGTVRTMQITLHDDEPIPLTEEKVPDFLAFAHFLNQSVTAAQSPPPERRS
jgi:hypothetical protein